MNTKHTPGPWRTDENEIRMGHAYERRVLAPDGSNGGCVVAQLVGDDRIANAEFIVRACNSHYELLEALKLVTYSLAWHVETQGNGKRMDVMHLAQAREAIAKATKL